MIPPVQLMISKRLLLPMHLMDCNNFVEYFPIDCNAIQAQHTTNLWQMQLLEKSLTTISHAHYFKWSNRFTSISWTWVFPNWFDGKCNINWSTMQLNWWRKFGCLWSINFVRQMNGDWIRIVLPMIDSVGRLVSLLIWVWILRRNEWVWCHSDRGKSIKKHDNCEI